ncbi:unnamed protein product [Adineta steineri]|uniref:Uncharacterized protein n=1 Tax=Adineta steineri TaxID=433720 RepID=A0A815Y6W5_9BILA|nr:unnamed protein product [Adineta steineri]CAF1566863.1 unnamed protein product [Adineta steineri]
MPNRFRKRSHILYILVTLNIIFFLVVYRRLILITSSSVISSVDLSIASFNENNLDGQNDLYSSLSSSICYIPTFDPWDQTVAKTIRIKPIYRCPMNKQSLINIIDNTQLVFNQTVNETFYSSSITHCVYLKVGRNSEEKFFRDWSYTLSEPILIVNGRTDSITDVDFVLTRCYNDRQGYFNGTEFCGYKCLNTIKINPVDKKASPTTPKSPGLVYEYIHPLIRLKKPRFSRDVWLNKENSNWISKLLPSSLSNRSPPSVIMVILDAVSDLQARRALPQTLSYLKSQGLFTFQRHAIVGDGTFENIVPMLFGQPSTNYQKPNMNDSRYEFPRTEIKVDKKTKKRYQIKKIVHYPGPYDDYPFILKNFSKLNYTTFFSEEWRESAFYNLKNGFRQQPTDFYLRPYWLALYETMSYNKYGGNSNPKPCYLNKLLHFLSLDWLERFLTVHHKTPDYPTFGIMKMNEMSHDYLERLFWIDYDLKNFFENLFQKNLLNNTILIFCGDHGHRQHRLRQTRIGSFEVKLPFFSMLFPQSYKQQFPQAMKNLKNNEQMLTSWWDVYETLANILKMVEEPNIFDPLLVNWRSTTTGISLFHPIPERNCSSAGIPEKYCPCSRSTPLDITLPVIKELALASIDHITNVKLKSHMHLCLPLELKTIIRAEVEKLVIPKIVNNKTAAVNFTHSYTVLFEVSPSGGIFESRLLYHEQTKKIQLHSDILRVNLYGQTSACIQDKYELRSFCYCISYHQKLKNNQSSSITVQYASNTTVINSTTTIKN